MIIRNYTFDKTAKTITCFDYATLAQNGIKLIVNTSRGIIYYNFASSTYTATVSGNVVTLSYNTASHSDSDKIMIVYEEPAVDDEQVSFLRYIKMGLDMLRRPPWWDPTINRVRETAVIESGTVTTVTTCANVTQIDSIQGRIQPLGVNATAWAQVARARIS